MCIHKNNIYNIWMFCCFSKHEMWTKRLRGDRGCEKKQKKVNVSTIFISEIVIALKTYLVFQILEWYDFYLISMFVQSLSVKLLRRLLKVLVAQAGGMTQRWRSHTTLVEVPSLVPKTPSGGSQLSVTPDPEDRTSSSGLFAHLHLMHTHPDTGIHVYT